MGAGSIWEEIGFFIVTQFPLSLLTDDEHKQTNKHTNIQTNTRDRQTNILSLVAKNEHEQIIRNRIIKLQYKQYQIFTQTYKHKVAFWKNKQDINKKTNEQIR